MIMSLFWQISDKLRNGFLLLKKDFLAKALAEFIIELDTLVLMTNQSWIRVMRSLDFLATYSFYPCWRLLPMNDEQLGKDSPSVSYALCCLAQLIMLPS